MQFISLRGNNPGTGGVENKPRQSCAGVSSRLFGPGFLLLGPRAPKPEMRVEVALRLLSY